ncbi:Rho termination factor N-terminal domain-containing protein [Defluviitalea saccharophila]|uniref:Rho termination factor N-terminal domain-containing protein n=1 Tax=Defluviitalea saccharophila TaxID=879970 RepID=A0ABZ2Y9C8_9FIRM
MQAFSMSASSISLESMTKKELLALADNLGVEGLNDRMLKADIIERIKEEM